MWLTLATTAALFAVYAWPFFVYLDFHPLNGAFQIFNPTRRLLSGEWPNAGFQPYLGVGVTFAHALATFLLGGNFAASQLVSHLVPPLATLTYVALLLFLARIPKGLGLLLFWSTVMLSLATLLRTGLPPWGLALPDVPLELLGPGTSMLATRALVPVLVAVVIFATRLRRQPIGRRARLVDAVSFGALTGLQPFWSNDFGLPSATCLALAYWAAMIRVTPAPISVIVGWLTGAIAAFGAGLAVSGGASWLDYNFSGVLRDQFWYFLSPTRDQVYSAADLNRPWWLLVYGGACAWLFWRAIRGRHDRRGAVLFYVATVPWVSALLGLIGSGISERYLVVAKLLLPFVIFAVVREATGPAALRHPDVTRGASLGPPPRPMLMRSPYPLLAMFLLVLWGPRLTAALFAHVTPRVGYFQVPELGGQVQEFYAGLIAVGREVGAKTAALPPSSRITSTYASALDVVAGSRNASGQDYIIHALGNRQRENYVRALRDDRPAFVSAVNDLFTEWGEWQWRANWWFFREMLKSYRPLYETPTHVIFERADAALPPSPANCAVQMTSPTAAIITVRRAGDVSAGAALMDVVLSYRVLRSTDARGGWNHAFRHQVRATEPRGDGISSIVYGLPPSANAWPILVRADAGAASVRIDVEPASAFTLAMGECTASVIGLDDDLRRGPAFSAATRPLVSSSTIVRP